MNLVFAFSVSTAIILILSLFFYLPDCLLKKKHRRSLKLAEFQLELVKIANEFQDYMRDRTIKKGEVVHDILYEIINNIQYLDSYISLRPFFVRGNRNEVRALKEKLDEELSNLPEEIHELVDHHFDVFLEAMKIRHPVIFRLLFVCFALKTVAGMVHDHTCQRISEIKTIFTPTEVWHDNPVRALIGVWAITISLFMINNPGTMSRHAILQSVRTHNSAEI